LTSCALVGSSAQGTRRYHVGESLIPSVRRFLRFIDADDKVTQHGFVVKVSLLRIVRKFMR
jgi:hypothetical protein